MVRIALIFVVCWLSVETGGAQERKEMPPAEGTPTRPIDTPDYIVGGPLPRLGTRESWQYFGVNRFGRFVPRVIWGPQGAYYYRTGEPFPWAQTRPQQVMPMVVD